MTRFIGLQLPSAVRTRIARHVPEPTFVTNSHSLHIPTFSCHDERILGGMECWSVPPLFGASVVVRMGDLENEREVSTPFTERRLFDETIEMSIVYMMG